MTISTGQIVVASDIRALANRGIYGDGSDGDVTISSSTSLARDMFYEDLTINDSIDVNTAGYRMFVQGTLNNNGIINNDGGDGTQGSGGDGGGAGSLGGSPSGGGTAIRAGGGGGGGVVWIAAKTLDNSSGTIRADAGAGSDAVAPSGDGAGVAGVAVGGLGGGSGAGGDTTSQIGGASRAVTAPAANVGGFRSLPQASLLHDLTGTRIQGGAGGGSGAIDTQTSEAGGGGGGGGLVTLIYNYFVSGTEQAAAGTGGDGYSTGASGTAGAAGNVIKINNSEVYTA